MESFWIFLLILLLLIFFWLIIIGKNKKENIFSQTQSEISLQENIVCLGHRSDPTRVKGIKLKDKFVFPRWGKEPNWEFFDKNYVIINGIKIKNEHARDTSYQCWAYGTDFEAVDTEEFDNYLRQISNL